MTSRASFGVSQLRFTSLTSALFLSDLPAAVGLVSTLRSCRRRGHQAVIFPTKGPAVIRLMLHPASGLMPETAGRSRKSPVGGATPLTQCRRRGRYNGRFEISDTPTGMAREGNAGRGQASRRAGVHDRGKGSRNLQSWWKLHMRVPVDNALLRSRWRAKEARSSTGGRDGEQVVRRSFQAITGPTPKSSDAEARLRESFPCPSGSALPLERRCPLARLQDDCRTEADATKAPQDPR